MTESIDPQTNENKIRIRFASGEEEDLYAGQMPRHERKLYQLKNAMKSPSPKPGRTYTATLATHVRRQKFPPPLYTGHPSSVDEMNDDSSMCNGTAALSMKNL